MSYVLIVEDEPAVRRLVERLLSRTSHEVYSAETAAAASAILQERGCPKLMIIDMVLPDADGRDLLKSTSESCPDTKSVLMSGYNTDDLKDIGFTFDVTYLSKPFDNVELLAIVEAAMSD